MTGDQSDAGRARRGEAPQRLAGIDAAISNRLGVRLERSSRGKPKDWRIGDVSLPGSRALVVSAVDRGFLKPTARSCAVTCLGVLIRTPSLRFALVDDRLVIPIGQGLQQMLVRIARSDLATR